MSEREPPVVEPREPFLVCIETGNRPAGGRCEYHRGDRCLVSPWHLEQTAAKLRAENERLRKEVEFWRQRAKGAETEREVLHEENGKLAAEARWHKHSCGMAKDKLAKLEEVKDEQT